MKEFIIYLLFDEKLRIWTAECKDIPGLMFENSSFNVLLEKVYFSMDKLMEQSGIDPYKAYVHCKSNKIFTYSDYMSWPDDVRVELIDGEIYFK